MKTKVKAVHKPYVWFVEEAFGTPCKGYDSGCPRCQAWKGLLSRDSNQKIEKYLRKLFVDTFGN